MTVPGKIALPPPRLGGLLTSQRIAHTIAAAHSGGSQTHNYGAPQSLPAIKEIFSDFYCGVRVEHAVGGH